ncbi:hypothetical protein TNCV_1843891 [Trichonephila clavipes]|nr:hypothetical protein TNCV_1843891 [Trichonephila clavipes]
MSSFLVLSDGDTRNRWRDGQVCPDVGQGTMAPWARRPGCVLACDAQIGRGRSRETFEKKKKTGERGERTEGERREREETEKDKRVEERERGARLVWRKGLSPEIGVKKTMNTGGVENRIDGLHRLGIWTEFILLH